MNYGRILVGVLLTTLGVLFLLDGLDVLDAGRTLAAAWPVAVVAVGVVQLLEQRRPAAGPLVVVVLGLVLLGATTGVVPLDWSLLWPVALVAVGLWLVLRRGPRVDAEIGEHRIQATALLSGRELRNSNRPFEGGAVTAVLGGLGLDLRDAELPEEGATLDITAIMGGVDLVVPETWRVDVRAATILGGFDDRRRHTTVADGAPTLTITGLLLMGGGDLKSP